MRARLLSVAFAAALSLSGCATSPLLVQRSATITDQALEFNEAAALSDRQLILLNILRARDWESLSFTRLSAFQNNSSRELRAGLNASIGEGGHNDSISPSASVMGSHSPRFDLPVLTSQEFQRAIHSPVDLQLYQTFIDQGWQPGLIHMLLIERMTLSCEAIGHLRDRLAGVRRPANNAGEAARNEYQRALRASTPLSNEDQRVHDEYVGALRRCGLDDAQFTPNDAAAMTLYNYPTDWRAHLQFRRWLRLLMSSGPDYLRICADEEQRPIGAPLDAASLRTLAGVAAILNTPERTIRPRDEQAVNPTEWQIRQRLVSRRFGLGCSNNEQHRKLDAEVEIGPVQVRSVEGVIYYLGEITRVRAHFANRTAIDARTYAAAQDTRIVNEDAQPGDFRAPIIEITADASGIWRERLARESESANSLFLVERRRGENSVTVRHHGEDYTVPYQPLTCGSLQCSDLGRNRSQQVIEFVLQLLNMSQNRADLPVTPTVNVAP